MKPNTTRILELLKAKGPLTSGQINKALNIIAATARCAEMAKRGLLVDVGNQDGKRWAIASRKTMVEREVKKAVRIVVRKRVAESVTSNCPQEPCAPAVQQRAWYIVKGDGPFAESPTAYADQKRANAVAKQLRNGSVIKTNEVKG